MCLLVENYYFFEVVWEIEFFFFFCFVGWKYFYIFVKIRCFFVDIKLLWKYFYLRVIRGMIKLLFVFICIEKMKDCLILLIWIRLNKERMVNIKKIDKIND